jgi:hypothetical protein
MKIGLNGCYESFGLCNLKFSDCCRCRKFGNLVKTTIRLVVDEIKNTSNQESMCLRDSLPIVLPSVHSFQYL